MTPESLNRLVSCTADDSKIIGLCGETKVDNEEGSWWTMIQVSGLLFFSNIHYLTILHRPTSTTFLITLLRLSKVYSGL